MTDTKQGVIYLACPYSHEDPAVEQQRFMAVTQAAAELTSGGRTVFSPITMTHPITEAIRARDGKEPDHKGWMDFDQPFMEMCSEIYVLAISGWSESKGVQQEIRYFHDNKPVTIMHISDAALLHTLLGQSGQIAQYSYVKPERFQPQTQEAPTEEPVEQWVPDFDEEYWTFYHPALGSVFNYAWDAGPHDAAQLEDGRVFRTEAEAQWAVGGVG